MSRITSWRRKLAAPLILALIAGGAIAGAGPAAAAYDPDRGPFVTATPGAITPEALADTGVRIQGQSLNTGGPIQRQDINITRPDGTPETLIRYFNPANPDDGTFDVTFKPAAATVQEGTYTVNTQGFAGQASTAKASTTFEVAAEPSDPPATISVTPTTITPDAFRADGVQASGRTFDTGSSVGIERSNIVLTSPSGATANYFDLTSDGTFNVNIKPKGAVDTSPLEQGVYTVKATSLLAPEFTATTTFTVAGPEAPPPASINVAPRSLTGVAFAADGVQASGRTFDSGSSVNIERSDLVLTAPSGATANYFDLTSDGTFNVNIKPKGDVASNPVETGTYTLRATSLQDPSFTATTTFQVTAPAAPPVERDPEANANPESLTQSEFLANGVNLFGFTEDTPGNLTRQRIQVTTPGGDVIECADFTGDGTYNIQVYPSDAPDSGPEDRRVCDLSTGGVALPGGSVTPVDLTPVPVGVYQVTSFGLISEDARASTSFEVTADPVPPVERDPEANADPESLTQSEFLANGVNLFGFTEDTPGNLTRQRIQVTTPGGDVIECADFTGDGTYNIQVYPSDAPDSGPEDRRVCDLSTGGVALPGGSVTPVDLTPVPVGTYQVTSFGLISEDARATTSFEVVADEAPGNGDGGNGDGGNGDGGNGNGDGDGDGDNGNGNGNDGNGGNGNAGNDNAGNVDNDVADGNGILPNTGGSSLLWLVAGLSLLAAGGVAVAMPRRRGAAQHLS